MKKHPKIPSHAFAVAPMLERTDRHFRYFFRQISAGALLYTEMVFDLAILHGDAETLLGHRDEEHPLALQIASSDPARAARAVKKALAYTFDEVNLNVGCPSEKSQNAGIGAVLMRTPERVAEIARAVYEETGVRISVKHRLGLDTDGGYAPLARFVETVAGDGVVTTFIVHARKALLSLDTRKNREVPPLRHDLVHRLKREHPELTILTNGGIQDLEAVARHLEAVDGVMVGRAATEDPWRFAAVDAQIFGLPRRPTRQGVVEAMAAYLENALADGAPAAAVLRHLIPLFRGVPGARRWRRALTETVTTPEGLLAALKAIPPEIRLEPPMPHTAQR